LKSLIPLYKSPIFLKLLSVSSSSVSAFRYSLFWFLKFLLASNLHCLDYRHCFGLVIITNAFWPDSFDLKIMNILYQNMVNVASICTDLDSLADIFIFSLMFSQALFMSLLFCKAANLCENLT